MMVPQMLSNGFILPLSCAVKVAVFYSVFQQNLRGGASQAVRGRARSCEIVRSRTEGDRLKSVPFPLATQSPSSWRQMQAPPLDSSMVRRRRSWA